MTGVQTCALPIFCFLFPSHDRGSYRFGQENEVNIFLITTDTMSNVKQSIDLTSSGGMFFDMQKKQADTLYGKISNLKDAYQLMLNDIGEANDGLLKGGVNAISALIRNWDTVASVLKVVVAAYGAYKAASLASMIIDRTRNSILKESIVIMRANAAANVIMSREQVVAAARTNILTSSFTKLKAAMLSNPITAILTGLAALGTIVYEVGKKYEWFASNVEKGASSAKR